VRLFPGVALARLRHLVDHVVQPGMPFRRHLGAFRLAIVDDPAPLAAEPAAAQPPRLVALQPVIPVAVIVDADRRAAQPGQQPCSERCAHAVLSRCGAAGYRTARSRGKDSRPIYMYEKKRVMRTYLVTTPGGAR